MAQDKASPMDIVEKFEFLSINEFGKVHCALTGRDVPLRTADLERHLQSGKLAIAKASVGYDFAQHKYITPHKDDPRLMFCHLTKKTLNRVPEQLEKHVQGRRYRLRLKEREEAEAAAADEAAQAEREKSEIWVPGDSNEASQGGSSADGGLNGDASDVEDDDNEDLGEEEADAFWVGGRPPRSEAERNAASSGGAVPLGDVAKAREQRKKDKRKGKASAVSAKAINAEDATVSSNGKALAPAPLKNKRKTPPKAPKALGKQQAAAVKPGRPKRARKI